ncbi:hypothetical protein [Candidatus Methylomirabilis limnetica]|uniref:hypothetical protein n=1 Tax=Candidatus Methylomirabilis limnetica TaxID=2033718 RepID=UPI001EFE8676|nr:hypothetical protein [Candidatus Methylomirabilis limnetica]
MSSEVDTAMSRVASPLSSVPLPHAVTLPGRRIPEHRETSKRIVDTEPGPAVAPLGAPAVAGYVQLKGDIRRGPVHASLAEGVGVAMGRSGLTPRHRPDHQRTAQAPPTRVRPAAGREAGDS